MRPVPHAVARILEAQDGIATRRQLLDAGFSVSALRWRCAQSWDLVLPGVVHADRSALTGRQRLAAARLYAGEGTLIGGLAAAHWYGVESAARRQGGSRRHEPGLIGPVRVNSLGSRMPRDVHWVRVRRTRVPEPAPTGTGPLLFVSPARAVTEAAREAPTADQSRGIVIEAVQKGIATTGRIVTWNHLLGRPGSAVVTAAVAEAAATA